MNYKEEFLKSINKIAEKEIDKVNINQHYLEVLESQDKEIEKLHSIIKEVREFIEEKKYSFCDEHDLRCEDGKKILEILDKVGDEK